LFRDDRTSFDQYIEIVNKRMNDVANDTYMNAGKMTNMSPICYAITISFVTNMYPIGTAGALNPCGHYVFGMSTG
jgi:hypothetical protein